MARRILALVALAAVALAPLASAQINCYETTSTLYPPPPPPSPPITGIPPINLSPIVVPSARDFLISYLQQYGASLGPVTQPDEYTIGTQRAAPSVGAPYVACISWSGREVIRTTGPAGAEGIKVVVDGTYVGGIPIDCNTFNTARTAITNVPVVAPVPWTWNAIVYTYTFIQESSSLGDYSCCSTNLCNNGGATITTYLSAGSAIANMVLLAISAVACMVLSKML